VNNLGIRIFGLPHFNCQSDEYLQQGDVVFLLLSSASRVV